MKKLMAFALAAIMLVGVLPFGASADTAWQVNIYIDDATDPIQTTAGDGEKLAIVDLAANVGVSEDRIKGLLVNGSGVGKGYVIEFTGATDIKIVTFTDAEMPAPPADVTFSVNYGNGTSKKFTMKEGDVAGSDVFPTTITYKGYEFVNYTLNGAEVSASSAVHSSWSSEIIQANWAPNGCPKCGWPTANGHADDCDLNPNKPTEAPETQAPETQAPVDTAKAYLNVFVNGVKKVETYGSVNEIVPVANCISAAKVASANVTSVVLNNNTLSTSGSFQLGAGGSHTNLYLNVSTASTGTGSTGSNSGSNSTGNNVNNYFGDEALSPVWLYIYTNDNLNHPTKMINITNYTITDDTITKKEVLTVIDDYYKASNANNGIIWKGMYMEHDDSNTSSLDIYQWVYGNIGDAVYNVNKARTEGTVIIMARVTGVTTVSSSTADSSNPKTGDQIFAPVAIMAVSACALAAVAFYLNKKRAV